MERIDIPCDTSDEAAIAHCVYLVLDGTRDRFTAVLRDLVFDVSPGETESDILASYQHAARLAAARK